MRTIPTLLLIFLFGTSIAQTNSLTVSMSGIGEIRVGMKKEQLEKLTGKSLKPVNLRKTDDWQRDTVSFVYKDIAYEVMLDRDPLDAENKSFVVYEVKSSGAQLKTRSGIAIGDDKLKIVSTYQDFTMHIAPDYEQNYTVKSKTRSVVTLYGDESNTVIVFYLTNNKVTGFSVMYNEGC
ncbi:MAG TPA: hypothetical protein VFR58_03580 [Flavisolibacter sp.]|nr:hypothetical protein [Flavisolibacter sp.]